MTHYLDADMRPERPITIERRHINPPRFQPFSFENLEAAKADAKEMSEKNGRRYKVVIKTWDSPDGPCDAFNVVEE
jgi:hypothetical protein